MYKKFLFLLFLPFILTACGDDEPQNDLFEIVVSEAPTGTELTIDDTYCGISTSGEAQTIAITLIGDYDTFRVTSSIPDWMYCTSSDHLMKFKLNEYYGDEYDMRSADITFVVSKGKSSVNGRIIIHQYAIPERIASFPVYLDFATSAAWSMYGVQPFGYRYFNKSEHLPADFPYTENSATGFGGILLVADVNGTVRAYDAACPVEGKADVRVHIDEESMHAVCPNCSSCFDVFTYNGTPLSGIALDKKYGLKNYKATKNANGGYVITL